MALAAVRSVMDTIYGFTKSSARIPVASSTREILEFAYARLKSLQIALLNYAEINKVSSQGVMDFEARIRDEVRKLEDAIETEAFAQFLSLNLDHLSPEIHRFAEAAKKMEVEYVEELHKPSPQEDDEEEDEEEEDEDDVCDMIGLADQFLDIRDELITRRSPKIGVKINGMAGIGKTALARKIFNDSLVKNNFECRAFVRVGRKYVMEKILQAVVAQINLDTDMEGDDGEDLYEYFKRSLKGRKCLIVLDDVWDFDFYRLFEMKLPKEDHGIRILLISRATNKYLDDDDRNLFRMRFLNKEESWDLLEKKVFGEEECPYRLSKAGKKIAENCEGLPLLIIAVAQILSKGPKDLEYWNEVAENQNPVFENALDQILKVLSPSYHYLEQYLKMNFLYFGAFPQDYKIRRSKIVNLWLAEGFFDPCSDGAEFDELVNRNLVVARERRPRSDKTKTCSLHIGYRHLNKREVESNKFLHILNSYGDCTIESVKSHRCLAFYKNVLLAFKGVQDSIASISTARSLLLTGPYHQYEVPIGLEYWRLLRVLDALAIRFYEFPVEVVKLIRLRYLSLTCDANLPPSISKLWNLEYLIVQQHLCFKRVEAESYVPVEIWDLQKLLHLQIVGRNIPNPPFGMVLPKLRRLLDGVLSGGMSVLRSIPDLEKLRIRFELEPDVSEDLSFFYNNLPFLKKLTSFQSVIINPEPMRPPSPPHLAFFIPGLEKLSLSGFGYPWEYMSKIGELQNLRVLKLKNYAFEGEKWEAKGKEFRSLEYLLIEDTDLVQWRASYGSFPKIQCLTMKNCYNLEEIPLFSSSMNIELVDCNSLVETYTNQLVDVGVNAIYSWK